jgi:hypothetical protein
MKRLITCSIAVLFSTAAMAQNPTGSGQTAGGPARGNISETGGSKAPPRAVTRQRSGQTAGGPAGNRISETGGFVPSKARDAAAKKCRDWISANTRTSFGNTQAHRTSMYINCMSKAGYRA